MKRKLSLGLVAVAAAFATLLTGPGPSIRAQPVANITLPPPGSTEQLYSGCNPIALTFPDGTPSQTVVEAVAPAGSVEALWRFDAAQKTWQAFSPAAPQASDLLQVDFLDAVWLCMAATSGGPPPPAPTATATPTPQPPGPTATPTPQPPGPLAADLAVTDLFQQNLPVGLVVARITNNGPDGLTNASVQLTWQVNTQPYGGGPPYGVGGGHQISVTLNPGQTADFPTGLSIDISQAHFEVTCAITAPFNDPNPGNNSYAEKLPTADVEVVDFVLQGPPANREVHAVLRNNGPGTLAGVPASLECNSQLCPDAGLCLLVINPPHPPVPLQLNLTPGQTVPIQTPRIFDDSTHYVKTMVCVVAVEFNDPIPNNVYSETPVQ